MSGRASVAFRQCAELFDVLVAGDGESAILKAIEPNAPSFIDADDPKTDLFLTSAKLNELPFPARHLVDVESYHYSIDGVPAISMIAQLGCPFGCGFCGGRSSPMLRRIRTRTSENVVAEMKEIYKRYGICGFMFYDDELNVNMNMIELMESITELQRDLKTEFKLRGFIKAQLFTDEQARAMYRAGFRWILTGFESGSERILTNINKQSTLEENTRCMDIARRNGLKVKALMSLGHPGESYGSISDTARWLIEVRPNDFDVTIITTYPGSPYYDEAVRYGEVWKYTHPLTGDNLYAYELDYMETADYYKGDPNGGYKAFVYTDHLIADSLVACRNNMEEFVRQSLNIPFNPSASSRKYEHSMGQGLGTDILRRSETVCLKK